MRGAVAEARRLARETGTRLHLAGGVVRDLLSGRAVRDVDLVVEGAAADFARRLAKRLGPDAAVKVHERFGTATLTLAGGSRLDLASSRREAYAAPGELPRVTPGASIEEDLARRDFTINAMAMELAPGRRPGVTDPFGGRRDLARRTVRALHAGSFEDDPTRAFRAVRYANRLGFRIDPATRRAIRRAVESGAFDRVSGARLRAELVKLFAERGRGAAVRRLHALGLDSAIRPALGRASRSGAIRRLSIAEGLAAGREGVTWLCYLLAWMGRMTTESAHALAARLELAGREAGRLHGWPRTLRRVSPGISRRRPSEIARRTAGLSEDELLAAASLVRGADRRVLTPGGAPGLRLRIGGADLVAAGIPAGPAVGEALARTLDARLDGEIPAGDELAFALRAARSPKRRS